MWGAEDSVHPRYPEYPGCTHSSKVRLCVYSLQLLHTNTLLMHLPLHESIVGVDGYVGHALGYLLHTGLPGDILPHPLFSSLATRDNHCMHYCMWDSLTSTLTRTQQQTCRRRICCTLFPGDLRTHPPYLRTKSSACTLHPLAH